MVNRVSGGSGPATGRAPDYYVMCAGDTSFQSIAAKLHIRTSALVGANPDHNPKTLRLGVYLQLPDDSPKLRGPALSLEANHEFTPAELRPAIHAAASRYGVPPGALLGILLEESTSKLHRGKLMNLLTHDDGFGMGLCGLDPRYRGELNDFTCWSKFHAIDARGHRSAIPPLLQIEYLAMRLREMCDRNGGDMWKAVAKWHTGKDVLTADGLDYIAKVRARLAALRGK